MKGMYWLGKCDATDGLVKHMTEERFLDCFFEICEKHRKNGKALLFAFLLYNLKHANVIEALENRNYWAALDQTSGEAISVFALHSPDMTERYPNAQMKHDLDVILTDYFGDAGSSERPSVLFFQVVNDDVVDHYRVILTERTVEESYLEMREVLDTAAQSVSKVTAQNRGNAKEIFNLVSGRLKERRSGIILKRGIEIVLSVEKMARRIAAIWG